MINDIFINIAGFIKGIFEWVGLGDILTNLGMAVVYFVAIIAFILLNVMIIVWLERRVSAFMQERRGPNRVGPFGLLQSLNDVVKLATKEPIIPKAVDKPLYKLAPILVFTTTMLLYAVLPFGKGMAAANINVGLLYFISVSSTTTISLLMAGWGSNNKYSLLGGMRTVAQMISYEIPLAFSMLGVIMITGTLNFSEIVVAQKSVWFILLQPVAFILFFISGTAELNRAPFDMPEAEQEIVAGFHTEYSGIRFAFFYLAEYANLFSMSALGATLFLGGWQGPILPSWIWFIGKVYFMVFLFLWVRWSLPRLRMDRMMKLNWKVLIPIAIANILLTGIGIKIYQYFVS